MVGQRTIVWSSSEIGNVACVTKPSDECGLPLWQSATLAGFAELGRNRQTSLLAAEGRGGPLSTACPCSNFLRAAVRAIEIRTWSLAILNSGLWPIATLWSLFVIVYVAAAADISSVDVPHTHYSPNSAAGHCRIVHRI